MFKTTLINIIVIYVGFVGIKASWMAVYEHYIIIYYADSCEINTGRYLSF